MPTWSAIRCTSDRMWLEKITVRCPRIAATRLSISARPAGSSAEVGSSSISNSGSPTRAQASPSRWTIPRENPPTRRPAASARPAAASAAATAWLPAPGATSDLARSVTSRGGQPAVELGHVRADRDLAARDAQADRAAVGPPGRRQQRQQCRLARTVRPDEPVDRTARHHQVDVEQPGPAVIPGEPARGHDRVGAGGEPHARRTGGHRRGPRHGRARVHRRARRHRSPLRRRHLTVMAPVTPGEQVDQRTERSADEQDDERPDPLGHVAHGLGPGQVDQAVGVECDDQHEQRHQREQQAGRRFAGGTSRGR